MVDEREIERYVNNLFSHEQVYLVAFIDENGNIVSSKSKLQGDSIEHKLLDMLKSIVKAVYDSLNKFEDIEGVLRYITINMQSGFSILYIIHERASMLLVARSEKKIDYEEVSELINKIKGILGGTLE